MKFEIVERSTKTGDAVTVYSGYTSAEAAEESACMMQAETENFWYEVREERA